VLFRSAISAKMRAEEHYNFDCLLNVPANIIIN